MTLTREEIVAAQISVWSLAPYVWGQRDCVMLVADWVARWTGEDPARDLRLTYTTAGECQRVTGFFTDPLGLIAPRMAFLPVTAKPIAGDALLCAAGMRPFAGLCTGGHVASFREDGMVHVSHLRDVKLLRAWKVPCHA